MKTDHRETSDSYRGELFRRGKLRVIVCKDSLQWILQRQRGGKQPVGAAWDALGYFVTKSALKRAHRALSGADWPELDHLPDRINGRAT
ncbi:hypothetical protein [Pseudooceanicola sp.]|uniref:hypothetical protein n=1 Tax=Pseudooceanicola sp. TaxID=1914328 RepID=UPI003516F979